MRWLRPLLPSTLAGGRVRIQSDRRPLTPCLQQELDAAFLCRFQGRYPRVTFPQRKLRKRSVEKLDQVVWVLNSAQAVECVRAEQL